MCELAVGSPVRSSRGATERSRSGVSKDGTGSFETGLRYALRATQSLLRMSAYFVGNHLGRRPPPLPSRRQGR